MVSRHLVVKLYLWLLLALTLSVLGAGAVVGLMTRHDVEEHLRGWVLAEIRPARDTVAALLDSGLPLTEVRRVLAPLQRSGRVAVQVLDAQGQPLLPAPPDDGPPPPPPLDPDDLREVLGGEELLEWEQPHRVLVALPLRLPGDQTGALVIHGRRFDWREAGPPWRLLAGLAAVLVTLWMLSWPLARHLARPLGRMADVADALGRGNLDARITPADIQRHRWAHRHPRRDEIGRLAERFNRMAGNLQQMVMGHKQLLADISHELRSPLARLRLALELARGAEGAEQAQYLVSLERQADAMEAMIEELLLHARLEASPDQLRTEPVAPAVLLEEVLEPLRAEADAKNVTLHLELAGALPLVVADRRLLARALGNVLRNAVAYSPEGGTVRTEVRGETRTEGRRVTFSVMDEGPGVPPDQLERIFEPFVRTDAARSRTTGGVGLGLAIARRCMEAHGGGISAAPGTEGRGLMLHLWLPVRGEGR